ncbi:hypothetical protein D9758_010725 [Tetrapyrgos nigripes]|uniref:Uncharacterized protein n=1 Tax=Tetrapyrgos nigripes TaxID=182062 RepID=A0A8H5D716_9AGAR|nr:hypothetical protein D9758_010725 [Tetrapyrgos nigripes]
MDFAKRLGNAAPSFKSDPEKPDMPTATPRRHSEIEPTRRTSWFGRFGSGSETGKRYSSTQWLQEGQLSPLYAEPVGRVGVSDAEQQQRPPPQSHPSYASVTAALQSHAVSNHHTPTEQYAAVNPAAPHTYLVDVSSESQFPTGTKPTSTPTNGDAVGISHQSSRFVPRSPSKVKSNSSSSRQPEYAHAHTKAESRASSSTTRTYNHSGRSQSKGHGHTSSVGESYTYDASAELRLLKEKQREREKEKELELLKQTYDDEKQKWKQQIKQVKADLEEAIQQRAQDKQRFEQELRQEQEMRQRTIHEANGQIAGLSNLNKQYVAETERLRGALDAAMVLSETRAKELASAKAFLASDESSGADVLKLVNSLNDQVFQFAAQVVDAVEYREEKEMQTNDLESILEDAKRHLTGILGETAGIIAGLKASDELEYISQIAIQAILLQYCSRIVRVWSWQPELDAALQHIYMTIQQSTVHDDPALRMNPGRWRALTRANSRVKWKEEPDPMRQTIVEHVVDDITMLLILISGGRPVNPDEVEGKKAWACGKVSEIFQTASQLGVMVGDRITSVDYQIICPLPGEGFDLDIMVDDEEKETNGQHPMKVLCPCQMGVYHTLSEFPDHRQTLLKARVALSSVGECQ